MVSVTNGDTTLADKCHKQLGIVGQKIAYLMFKVHFKISTVSASVIPYGK